MRSSLIFTLILAWLVTILSCLVPHVTATDDEEASSNRNDLYARQDGHRLSSQLPPLPPSTPSRHSFEAQTLRRTTQLPFVEFVETSATSEQQYQALLRLRYRLVELGRNGASLQIIRPPHNPRFSHLYELASRLRTYENVRNALFLHVSHDRKGRLVAIPYAFATDGYPQRFNWVLLQVHPAIERLPPRIEWYAYVSHLEPSFLEMDRKLESSNDVQSLRYFLTRRV